MINAQGCRARGKLDCIRNLLSRAVTLHSFLYRLSCSATRVGRPLNPCTQDHCQLARPPGNDEEQWRRPRDPATAADRMDLGRYRAYEVPFSGTP